MLDLARCGSSAECLGMLADEARRTDARGWVLAFGARTESWSDRRWPTRHELDRVIPEHACAVMSFDHHAVCANTRALSLAGFSEDSADPAGGVIVRDARTGAASGLLLESAAYAVWNAAPEPTEAERVEHVRRALADLARHGFVEVHDLLSPDWLGQALAQMDDRGELAMRIKLFPAVAQIDRAFQASKTWARERVTLGGGKLFADGTLNSRTAWMLQPYADGLPGVPCGKAMATPEEIRSAVRACERHGLPLATHAIGDAAVRAVLDAIEAVGREGGSAEVKKDGAARGTLAGARPRHRIEHAELIDPADVPRFARLRVVVSVQPCHLLTDIEALTRSLPDRLDRVLPLRSLIEEGCSPGDLILFGSDTPIVRPDPADSVQAAVERRRSGMPRSEAIAPEQQLTKEEAWAAFGL